MAAGSFFESIETGDILSGINIANQGLSSQDLASIFGSMAAEERIQAAREAQERKRRTRLWAISGSVVLLLALISLLYYFHTKNLHPHV